MNGLYPRGSAFVSLSPLAMSALGSNSNVEDASVSSSASASALDLGGGF